MKKLEQKELDSLKDEIQNFLNTKFKDREYMTIISIVGDYDKDAKTNKITLGTQYIRISNMTIESPYIKFRSMLQGIVDAVNAYVTPEQKQDEGKK
jgi:hypothetical protein